MVFSFAVMVRDELNSTYAGSSAFYAEQHLEGPSTQITYALMPLRYLNYEHGV
jgi:hypothetical protein